MDRLLRIPKYSRISQDLLNARIGRLRFPGSLPGHLEEQFKLEYNRAALVYFLQIGVFLGSALYFVFAYSDYVIDPENSKITIALRTVTSPCILTAFFAPPKEIILRYLQSIAAAAITLGGVELVFIYTILHDGLNLGVAGIVAYLMFLFGFCRLLFLPSVLSSLAIVAAYNFACVFKSLPIPVIIANNFALMSALIVGISVTYLLEKLFRAQFLGTRELEIQSEIGAATSATLDLAEVLDTIIERAVTLAGADAGAVFALSEADREFHMLHSAGHAPQLREAILHMHIGGDATIMNRAIAERATLQIRDTQSSLPLDRLVISAGFQSGLIVPMLRGDQAFGTLVVISRTVDEFPEHTVHLMEALAGHSVLAIQNARLFQEIQEKNQLLEQANQHKSQFLANMSHELRTPLNAILGYVELLIDSAFGILPSDPVDVLKRVDANGKHLLTLINDVLDLSKIEAGQLTLIFEEYSLQDVVQGVLTVVEPLAAEKNLELRVDVGDDLPNGCGDYRRIIQVLVNLVGNAIKFTEVGYIEIAASIRDGDFEISVRDTGPGIAEKDQKRIFEAFQQADASITREKGGTGLGLAISRQIVEMHGGVISLESSLGEGTTFRVLLPTRVEEPVEIW